MLRDEEDWFTGPRREAARRLREEMSIDDSFRDQLAKFIVETDSPSFTFVHNNWTNPVIYYYNASTKDFTVFRPERGQKIDLPWPGPKLIPVKD